MKIYTLQLAHRKKAEEKQIPFIDTTVKSGHHAFAPTWPMVIGYKNGLIDEEEYEQRYVRILEDSLRQNPEAWEYLLSFDAIAVACYCNPSVFCHRHVLVSFIDQLCTKRRILFQRGGEIR